MLSVIPPLSPGELFRQWPSILLEQYLSGQFRLKDIVGFSPGEAFGDSARIVSLHSFFLAQSRFV